MKNKSVSCLYLFADGHAVVVYSVRHPLHGSLEHVEIYEKISSAKNFGVYSLPQSGRIVFHDGGFLSLLRGAKHVQVYAQNESEATRKMGLTVHSVEIVNETGSLCFNAIPSVLSGGFTLQTVENYGEEFNPDLTMWGDKPVAKVHRVKPLKLSEVLNEI